MVKHISSWPPKNLHKCESDRHFDSCKNKRKEKILRYKKVKFSIFYLQVISKKKCFLQRVLYLTLSLWFVLSTILVINTNRNTHSSTDTTDQCKKNTIDLVRFYNLRSLGTLKLMICSVVFLYLIKRLDNR